MDSRVLKLYEHEQIERPLPFMKYKYAQKISLLHEIYSSMHELEHTS